SESRRARITGPALRGATMLSVGRPGIIDETPLSYERDRLVVSLPKAYADLDGERLRRRFAVLAGLLERIPEVRLEPDKPPRSAWSQPGRAGGSGPRRGLPALRPGAQNLSLGLERRPAGVGL